MKNLMNLKEIRELSPEERIELAQDLWDSVAEARLPPLSDEQKAELDRRIENEESDPSAGRPWEEVKRELQS